MKNDRQLIITGLLLLFGLLVPEFSRHEGVWLIGSALFFILPGYWLLKFFPGIKIENSILYFALSFPASVAYLSLTSFLVNQVGVDVSYSSLLVLAGVPCLIWLSTKFAKRS